MINPNHYGLSFSLKQCRNFGLDPQDCLKWLLKKGWRRYRLMSYWNEHEPTKGMYDFSELDWQVKMVSKRGGTITLCLGVKQPRWPEYHWPAWAQKLEDDEKSLALLKFIDAVVSRYKDEPCVVSYQLENEALLSNFGREIHIDRARLRREYDLVKRLDPHTPIYMSTSNGWGIPLRRPRPWGGVGFSVYTSMFQKGTYRQTIQRPWLHRLRKIFIEVVLRRPVFIHELQCEPWGPKAIWEMSTAEQAKSMNPERIAHNIAWAQKIGAYPVDLWGAEWWYWRYRQGDKAIYAVVEQAINTRADNPRHAKHEWQNIS
ncbi:MAG: hypothetical protein WAQ24_05315 [Candidatus Saccharimonadales bacterium]